MSSSSTQDLIISGDDVKKKPKKSSKKDVKKDVILILAEKPTAAKKIANALEKKPKEIDKDGVKLYEIDKNGNKYIVAAAVGHLYSLKQSTTGWTYPIFDVKWIPSYRATRKAMFSKKYYEVLKEIAPRVKEVIVATDYDQEGSVIGYNIVRFLLKMDNAKRMKFSTLTKDELIKSFENASPSMDMNQVEAGLTRHYLDWFYGINTSRALTLAIKNIGERFKILSSGRVQGPLLKILYDHEQKIKKFKPKPYWQIFAHVLLGKISMEAPHEKDKFWKESEAKKAYESAKKSKEGVVETLKKRKYKQMPPNPFDTTALMTEAFRYFGYSPRQTMTIAEYLYQNGYISYPRTSSNILPPSIDFKKVLKGLSRLSRYKVPAEKLLQTELKPNNGKKKDPAHPAIYPTGEIPEKLTSQQQRVYDLIVRRFMATFGPPAERETLTVKINIGGEKFVVVGKRTIEKGWTQFYGRYSKLDELALPELNVGDKVKVKKVEIVQKETQPPGRYTQGSILKEAEKLNLGTKATRSQILQTLYDRGYVYGKSITVTDLGMKVAAILDKHVPEIVSPELTRKFEKKMEDVFNGKIKKDDVINEAKEELTKIFEKFKKKEKVIGKELTEAVKETQLKQSILGKCPNCGGELKVFFSWKTKKRFAGCSNYPKCKTAYPLPAKGRIEATGKVCDKCGTPIIRVFRSGKRPFEMCLDPNCPTKKDWLDKEKLKEAKERYSQKMKEENQ